METNLPDLTYIINLMKRQSGIVFSADKSYIILTKLYPLIDKYHFTNIEELLVAVQANSNPVLIADLIETLTINETSFFRDRYPYEVIDKYVIPELLQHNPNQKEIRILCAACSTGQEPYSLIMHFLEHKQYRFDCKITAIDLSGAVIKKAKEGIYNQFEIQRGLPITLLVKYFSQIEKDWVIKDELKKHIEFRQFNLVNGLGILGKFDLIFCRNVLIYFDDALRKQVILNLGQVLNPNSTLILGSSESVPADNVQFNKITEYSGVYRSMG